ncbi:MAG: hypothetical protein ABR985_22845, partial [Methanotrichaceae archaeon]
MAAASEQTTVADIIQGQPSVVVDAEFEALIPQLKPEELDLLEKSLIAEGCRDALSVWNDDGILRLVDGHHRLAFCEKHGIPYRINIIDGIHDRTDAKIWIILNQFARRNLSDFARSELALQLEPLYAAKAKKNLKTHTVEGYQPLVNVSNPAINTREELAKIAEVSGTNISKPKAILAKGSDLLKK